MGRDALPGSTLVFSSFVRLMMCSRTKGHSHSDTPRECRGVGKWTRGPVRGKDGMNGGQPVSESVVVFYETF
ncbi:hypothetical protein B0H13DRAFT_2012443 [Mycena leptocephala]|nr:hypothetical protein B0H13DRAFT_2012443 [Mycena leptocephala]